MPSSLTARIVASFAVLAVALWLAIGATMFVVLRGLHAEATSSGLADIAQTFAVRLRGAVAERDVRTVITQIQRDVAGGEVTVQLLAADGSTVELGAADPTPQDRIPVPATTRVGDTLTGTASFSDGEPHDYAALVLRGPGAAGSRAVLLSTVDRSGAAAIRDVGRSLPIVILATLLVGAPLAVVLSRSVARPIRRVAERATQLIDPASAPAELLPETGPREVRALTATINAMGSELARTRVRESELLADLRHDLRTPLTVIGGYAAALADGTASGDAAGQAATAIAEEAARLERLVAELGAIDRARSGRDGLHLEPLDARAVLDTTAARFVDKARSAGVEIVVAPAADAAGSVLSIAADRVALDRILGNLVDNALAAIGPRGTIRLEARPLSAVVGIDGSAVAFSVVDDGPGFPPGGTEQAFERFYRGDPSRAGAGSGLGLAIVRELARAHGGTAIAENLAPHGARVSVILPVQPPDARPTPIAQASSGQRGQAISEPGPTG
jgi:signal transduction histidine kinase